MARKRKRSSGSALVFADVQRRARQIFVAYPYKLFERTQYRKPFHAVGKALDVTFIFADTRISRMTILQKILDMIRASELGIYDVTGDNPNVMLELGLAFGAQERAYLAYNPKKAGGSLTLADISGIDRVEYTTFGELRKALTGIVSEEFPRADEGGTPDPVRDYGKRVLKLLTNTQRRLSVSEIREELHTNTGFAQLVVQQLLDDGRLMKHGRKKGTTYSRKKLARGRPKKRRER